MNMRSSRSRSDDNSPPRLASPRGHGHSTWAGAQAGGQETQVARGYREPVEKPRRFYRSVEVAQEAGGFSVRLDSRAVRTPGGRQLTLPARPLADQVAEEWGGQGETLDLAGMHATRLANTAIDAIPASRDETAQSVRAYAASDLICYFAEEPLGLVERQTRHWGPVLERAEAEAELAFIRTAGIRHRPQPEATLDRIEAMARALDDFSLAGLAFGAALFGSAILSLALQQGWLDGETAFALSRLDEAWQEEHWGVDAEAAERTERLRAEALMLARWFQGLERP
jgi:chaperone required for assembly of F1-ATPase